MDSTHMGPAKLVRAANQIAAFFAVYPRDEALTGIAGHIQKFWEPRMRREMAAHMASGGEGVDPLVAAAWEQVRV